EGHLFHHRKARRLVSGDFAKLGSLFQSFPIWVFKEPFLIFNIIIRVLDAYGQKRMFNDVPFVCWSSGFFKV
ncbi:hypothetical protein, partial [Pseudomonas savastanoi]|uniref:hypothetical protein n=1 Tax=Pseudomonas savastanoi TaxID=29438 RepID=UPI00196A1C0C